MHFSKGHTCENIRHGFSEEHRDVPGWGAGELAASTLFIRKPKRVLQPLLALDNFLFYPILHYNFGLKKQLYFSCLISRNFFCSNWQFRRLLLERSGAFTFTPRHKAVERLNQH